MSVKDIMELLRNHYKKDDRVTVSTSVQQAGVDAFVTELMWLRERVIE